MAVYFDFDPRLRELGRDLEWLARESGVSLVALKRHQQRLTTAFTFEVLEQVCRALHCQPGDILKRGDRTDEF
jgi:DNA-binding Xre family transcriptional regulator